MRTKKFDFFHLYFDLCWRAEINIQVGLNMHLYVDIGDASSSLWESTSSFNRKRLCLLLNITVSSHVYGILYRKTTKNRHNKKKALPIILHNMKNVNKSTIDCIKKRNHSLWSQFSREKRTNCKKNKYFLFFGRWTNLFQQPKDCCYWHSSIIFKGVIIFTG